MTFPTPTGRARAAGGVAAACALLASFAAHAQTSPPPSATPPAAGVSPPAAAPSPPPAAPPSPPPAAPPSPPPAAPGAAPAPTMVAPPAGRPPGPAPYPYPNGYPPPSYPYPYATPYPYAAPPAWGYPPGYAPAAYGQPSAQQPPPPPGTPVAYVPAASLEATAQTPPASMRTPAEDPQADRGVFLPTAYTHPKGTFFFSDYDLAIGQVGYAFTDDTQVTLTGIPPIGAEQIVVFDLTLKTSLHRGRRVRIAALGSTSGLAAKEIGVMGIGRAGGVVQLCIDTMKCGSSVSISSNLTLAGFMLMANGVSGIFRLGRTVSLLAELDTLLPLVRDAGEFGGAMAGGGVRFHWVSWGLDLALMKVIGNEGALPLIALTYRSI